MITITLINSHQIFKSVFRIEKIAPTSLNLQLRLNNLHLA